jgi:glycosyltransferase involved in cell wall biosynthesis
MAEPAVTVAMSVYNAAPFLNEAIASVRTQSFADFEFLILDDGSSDASPAIARSHELEDARIRVIARENRGLVASLNELLRAARAPLVARMDADDICEPERLARQARFLAAHPDYGVIGSWTTDIGPDGAPQPKAGDEQPTDHDCFVARIGKGSLLCHPTAMMRRDLVLSVGGYHGAFAHCEDFDLWLRLASVTKLGNLPERLLRYRHYEGQVSTRHAMAQRIGAAIALVAWQERQAGRSDPSGEWNTLPAVRDLDAAFGREGIARRVRDRVAPELLYVPEALRGPGLEIILDHLRDGGAPEGMWRTVARLVKLGHPVRATRLAMALAA